MKRVLIPILFIIFSSTGCFQSFDCGEEIEKEISSPDGKYTATLFERNCGATTSFIPHINLRESNKKFKEDNLNRVEEGYIKTPGTIENLTINWENNKTLKIKCPTCDSFKSANWNDVNIIYSK